MLAKVESEFGTVRVQNPNALATPLRQLPPAADMPSLRFMCKKCQNPTHALQKGVASKAAFLWLALARAAATPKCIK
jgi:hypothetical protein